MMHSDSSGVTSGPEGRHRFCPRCVKRISDGAVLCPECGESSALQGFCPVCDHFLTRNVGELCPKHDLPLEGQAPPPRSEALDGEFTDWVRVQTYPQPIAAQAGRIRLEAEGIPTFLEGERMGGHGLYSVAIGGVRLLVPRQMEHEARVLLSQSWSPPAELEDDLDDAWEDLAPAPGSRRRTVMKVAIIVILAVPLLKALVIVLAGR